MAQQSAEKYKFGWRSVGNRFKIASWNLQGKLSEFNDRQFLYQDMEERNVDIGCFQETRANEMEEMTQKGAKLKTFQSSNGFNYGLGFYVSSKFVNNIHKVERISDRLCVLQLKVKKCGEEKEHLISIINVYAPTATLTRDKPEDTDVFYHQLYEVVDKYDKESNMLILAGDFNARVGVKLSSEENFMGSWGKGTRNDNGERLVDMLDHFKLYLTNTRFKHRRRKISTWHGTGSLKSKDNTKQYHHQIDYIIIKQKFTKLLTNSKAYGYNKYISDHSLVITTFDFSRIYRIRPKRVNEIKYDMNVLVNNNVIAEEFQECLKKEIATHKEKSFDSLNEKYEDFVTNCIQKVVKQIVPVQAKAVNNIIHFDDHELGKLVNERRIVNDVLRKKNHITKDDHKTFRTRMTKLKAKIHKRVIQLRLAKLDALAKELESNKSNSKCFYIQRVMKCRPYDKFKLVDETGKELMKDEDKISAVNKWYISFYNQVGMLKLDPFIGDPGPLDIPFTEVEIKAAIKRLNNNRACGKDGIYAEIYKYGGEEIAKQITEMLNEVFEKHDHLNAIGEGILIPLNKPGKTQLANNTRPITLLNMTRKVISNTFLERVYNKVDGYLCLGQSGFRKNRSTTDVIWTYRWLKAIGQRYDEVIKIVGIDLSKAFDCINREKLMKVFEQKELCSKSDLRILNYLLSNTKLTTRINGTYGEWFDTTIGTPQGDALSPILFTVYLEAAIREYLEIKDIKFTELQMIILYADDTDFINLENFEDEMAEVLKKWNLKENADKRERITIHDSEANAKLTNRKLGNAIDDVADMKRRMNAANVVFRSMHRIWRRPRYISLKTRIRFYNTFVKSILLYNLAAVAVTDCWLKKVDAFHRKHLRQILHIHYPNTIHNIALYNKTGEIPISVQITGRRWTYFGHALRSNEKTPMNLIMDLYFTYKETKKSNLTKAKTTLPTLLHKDLMIIDKDDKQLLSCNTKYKNSTLSTFKWQLKDIIDLNILRYNAKNRLLWRQLTVSIFKMRLFNTLDVIVTKSNKRQKKAPAALKDTTFVIEDKRNDENREYRQRSADRLIRLIDEEHDQRNSENHRDHQHRRAEDNINITARGTY